MHLLNGIKVLDLFRAIAGPYCTLLLGDFGATVIKVEPPSGDLGRASGLSHTEHASTYFLAMNRNKRSICLDLARDGASEVLDRLVSTCDILVENFRPGVLGRLGYPEHRLYELNANLILCSITGYGPDSAYAHRKGLDLIGQATGGIASVTGVPGSPPSPAGAPVSDMLTALNACVGILVALCGREREKATDSQSKHYRTVDVNLIASTAAALSVEASAYLNTGKVAGQSGGAWFEMFPYDIFPAIDGHVAIGVGAGWSHFCRILGIHDLAAREELEDMANRLSERQYLKERISDTTARFSSVELIELLESQDILCGLVKDISEAINDPGLGLQTVSMHHPIFGPVRSIASAPTVRIGTRQDPIFQKPAAAPPLLGEHTLEIMAELGFNQPAVDRLLDSGAVAYLP